MVICVFICVFIYLFIYLRNMIYSPRHILIDYNYKQLKGNLDNMDKGIKRYIINTGLQRTGLQRVIYFERTV